MASVSSPASTPSTRLMAADTCPAAMASWPTWCSSTSRSGTTDTAGTAPRGAADGDRTPAGDSPSFDGGPPETVNVTAVAMCNGRYFGGGMKVAPRALPDDGKFNVQMYTGRRSQFFLGTMKIFRGEHLPDPEAMNSTSDARPRGRAV